VRELLSDIHFHELASDKFEIGGFTVTSQMVIHLNPTLGFRLEEGARSLAFIPDHEPVLSSSAFGRQPEWTSGFALAKGADLLIHDAQYTHEEYQARVGFGHSSITDAVKFAGLAQVRRCLLFHHDPAHSDDLLDRLFAELLDEMQPAFEVILAVEGMEMELQ
jgi:phosphoribosyl 1,2-cyclic phosphodiesterase